MFEIITEKTMPEYEAFLASHPKGHFLQSHLWAPVKGSWKWQAICTRDETGKICGAAAVLIRKMPGLPYTLMYAGRGPVCDVHDEKVLAALTEGLRELARIHKSYALKLDPDVPSSDATFLAIMDKLGYRRHVAGKNFEGIQPNYVFRLDVKGKTEDDILKGMASKTRYNLRLSSRKGVTVRQCGKEMLKTFTDIMKETGERDNFITRPQAYFEKLLDSLGEHARLYMAFWDERPIAGTIAIHYGNKVWYLYGASSNQYRNVMPNYQLQWEMIRWALEEQCDIYDFRGVSGDLTPDNPLYGLYLFKKGFGGELVEFCGEFEMVYKPFIRFAADSGFKTLRKIRYRLTMKKDKATKPKEKE